MCYVTYLGAYILPLKRTEYPDNETLQGMYWFIYVSLLVTAAICGFGASILWVAQGQYVTKCATDANKGLFNSVFYACLLTSMSLGNILGAVSISKLNPSGLYIMFTCFALIASFYFLLLPEPKKVDIEAEVIVEAKEASSEVTPQAPVSAKGQIRQTWDLMISRKMLIMVPLMTFSSANGSLLATTFVPMLTRTMKTPFPEYTKNEQTQVSCTALIFLGVGSVIGSAFNGKIHDKIGTRHFSILCVIEELIAYATLVSFVYNDHFSMGYASVTVFLIGLADSAL